MPSSGVLALLRGSTYRGEPLRHRNHWRGFSVHQDQFKGRTAHTKCGTYLLPLRLLRPCWAAFLSILQGVLPLSQTCGPVKFWRTPIVFPQPAR